MTKLVYTPDRARRRNAFGMVVFIALYLLATPWGLSRLVGWPWAIAIGILMIGMVAIAMARNFKFAAASASCGACNSPLQRVLDEAGAHGIGVRFCPHCGTPIER